MSRIQRGLEERGGWWNRLLDRPDLWALVAVVGCTWLVMPRTTARLPVWEPGEVATFDVVAPRDLTLPDQAATEAVREEARQSVLPVYDFEPRLQLELVDGLRALFAVCRSELEAGTLGEGTIVDQTDLRLDDDMQRVLESAECSPLLEEALVDVVGQVYRSRVVDDRLGLEQRGEGGMVVRNLDTDSERTVDLAEVSGVLDLRTGLESALRNRLLEHDVVARRWIKPAVTFLETNISPNLVFNRAETAERVRRAAANVTPRSQVFRRGQVLVRRGDTVTAEIARTLAVIRGQRQDLTEYSKLLGIALLVVLLVVGWWRVLGRFSEHAERRPRLSMVLILVLLFTACNRLGVFLAGAVALSAPAPGMATVNAYLWALPYAAGPAVVSLLLGVQVSVLFALGNALLAGLMLGGDFAVVIYALSSGLVGALATQRFRDRTAFSRVGAVVGGANLVVLLVLELYRGMPDLPEATALAAVCAVIGGPLSVGLVSFLMPSLESVFRVTTDIRLLELSNQNLPLLKRLSLEAPGTYQHSLAVGNLAEAGADAVGANALLLRVCAYYHDVGKLVKPEYFVENQRGSNPHDTLSPSMSALVIQSHVKEGLEMARAAKLPLPIRQAIATHHGTKLIRYFYSRAKERSDPGMGEVRESDYRYPGPKPHTKELGVLLLADAVEAAARTLETPTPGRIQSMINKIFADALEDGQLDDCDLTFSELDKIASAFLWVLTNMYHHRIDYPGFDFNRRQERRDSGALHVAPKTVTTGG